MEDVPLLRGQGRFAADLALKGLAFLRVVRSPYAHARIRHIASGEAERSPGVLAVLTAAEAERDGLNGLPADTGRGFALSPYPILAHDRVRHVGDPVAAIIATSEAAASDAEDRLVIAYEPLPAVATIAQALMPGAPLVWEEAPGNRAFQIRQGDGAAVAAAFASAAHVTKLDLEVSRVTAATLEPRAATGLYEPDGERYTLFTSVQAPHQLRDLLAALFAVPKERLRVKVGNVGGSFGLKAGLDAEYALVLWAARRTGRPVRWVASRTEAFISDDHARDQHATIELALGHSGEFLAVAERLTVNLGAYPSPRSALPLHNIGGVAGVYRIPHILVEAACVVTHTIPTAPYRGSGRPEASYAIERVIDVASMELGIDRVELRRRNLIPSDAMPFKTGLTFTYDSGDFEAMLDRALILGKWSEFPERRAQSMARGKRRGIGLAQAIHVSGGPFPTPLPEEASIRFAEDGSVLLKVGTMEAGQGHATAFRNLIAAQLGVAPARVRVIEGDTETIPFSHGSGASRSLQVGGSAVILALERILGQCEPRGQRETVGEARFQPSDVCYPNSCQVAEVE